MSSGSESLVVGPLGIGEGKGGENDHQRMPYGRALTSSRGVKAFQHVRLTIGEVVLMAPNCARCQVLRAGYSVLRTPYTTTPSPRELQLLFVQRPNLLEIDRVLSNHILHAAPTPWPIFRATKFAKFPKYAHFYHSKD